MTNSKETPINRETYRFTPTKRAGVEIRCRISPELHKQIHRLACHDGTSIGKAIEKMCRTKEAQALVPSIASKMFATAKATSKRAISKLFRSE